MKKLGIAALALFACLLMMASCGSLFSDDKDVRSSVTETEAIGETIDIDELLDEETTVQPTEEETEKVTEKPTEKPTQKPTQKPTEKPTEKKKQESKASSKAQSSKKQSSKAQSSKEQSSEADYEYNYYQSSVVSANGNYVLNTNTRKFHYPDCSSVNRMNDSNKEYYTGSRDDLIAQGYSPCGRCNP